MHGSLPISIDYCPCPQIPLIQGPMIDISTTNSGVRTCLGTTSLIRSDVTSDPARVIATGWSTDSHLTMTLGWATRDRGVKPPDAVLGLYCPTDFYKQSWSQSHYSAGTTREMAASLDFDLREGGRERSVSQDKLYESAFAGDGRVSVDDLRLWIVLAMAWRRAQTVQILLRGLADSAKQGLRTGRAGAFV